MTDMREALDRPAALTTTRVALAARGDALTPYLFAAIERRFASLGRVDPELSTVQRYLVAATTFRPSRSAWAERFYKSAVARRLRSANAVTQLKAMGEQPDAVVQVHALFDQPVAPSLLYIDCTHHQSAAFWPPWNPLRGAALEDWYRREQATYEAAEHLFAFCEPTRRSLIDEYGMPPEKVTVVGAGANMAVLPDIAERTPAADPTVLFIGNDFVRKGGEVLLDAFRIVRERISDARLVLVGTRPVIAPQAGVEVLGRVRDRARIAQLYREAAVFCVPSFFDPYPLVLLEAMAHGVPVVTTAQTGTPEMVTDDVTATMVAPGDVLALAAALIDAIEDPAAAQQRAAAARRDVELRFTWDHVVDRMVPALEATSADRTR